MSTNPSVSATFSSHKASPWKKTADFREEIAESPPNDFGDQLSRLVKSKHGPITEGQPSDRSNGLDVSKLENWPTLGHREFQRAVNGEKVWIEHQHYPTKVLLKFQDGAVHCKWDRDDGKPGSKYIIKSTRCRDWQEGVIKAATLYEGRHEAATIRFAQAAEQWHAYGRTKKKAKMRSASSLKKIRNRLDRQILPLLGHVAVQDFSDATIMQYRTNYEAKFGFVPTNNTINGDTKIILAIVDFAERMMHVKLKHKAPALCDREEKRRATVDDAMCERLIAVAQERIDDHKLNTKAWCGRTSLRFNIMALRYTGCRPGEGRKLRFKDVGTKIETNGFVKVWIEFPSKNTRQRMVYADPRILDVVAGIAKVHPRPNDPAAPLFVTKAGTPTKEYHLTFKSLLKDMQKREPDVNWLTDFDEYGKPQNRTLYSLRHAYATAMLAGGIGGLCRCPRLLSPGFPGSVRPSGRHAKRYTRSAILQ
jgi:integrase